MVRSWRNEKAQSISGWRTLFSFKSWKKMQSPSIALDNVCVWYAQFRLLSLSMGLLILSIWEKWECYDKSSLKTCWMVCQPLLIVLRYQALSSNSLRWNIALIWDDLDSFAYPGKSFSLYPISTIQIFKQEHIFCELRAQHTMAQPYQDFWWVMG